MKHLSDNQFNNYAKAEQLERRVDHMEQYQRINGISCANEKIYRGLLSKVNSLVKNDLIVDIPDVFFAMTNVNCRLCWKLKDGFHNSEKETDLKDLLKYV